MLAQESATLCPPVFSQFAISNYLENCDWHGQIRTFRDMYRTRRGAMLATLERKMPDGCSWTRPAGGFFVWVTLPEGLNASTMPPRGVGKDGALREVLWMLGVPFVGRNAAGRTFAYGRDVVVEEFVEGTELSVTVLKDGTGPRAATRQDQSHLGVYDHESRYTAGATRFLTPGELPDDVLDRARRRPGVPGEQRGTRPDGHLTDAPRPGGRRPRHGGGVLHPRGASPPPQPVTGSLSKAG